MKQTNSLARSAPSRAVLFATAVLLVAALAAGVDSALAPTPGELDASLEIHEAIPLTPGRLAPTTPLPAIAAPIEAEPETLSLGDLAAMKARGALRVMTLDRHHVETADRVELRTALVRHFAAEHGLSLTWLHAGTPQELVSALVDGRADLLIDDLPLDFDPLFADSAEDRRPLARTLTIARTRFHAISRTSTPGIRSTADFVGRRVVIKGDSPVYSIVDRLARSQPGIQLHVLPAYIDEAVLLRSVARHEFDIAIVNSGTTGVDSNLRLAFELAPPRARAWTTRADNPAFLAALNNHLLHSPLLAARAPLRTGDLDEIRDHGVLRVITRRQRDNYFLDRGAAAGFEHEVISRFARQQRLRLRLVLADTPAQMRTALARGQGDVIVAGSALSDMPEREDIQLTRAYHHVSPTLLMRASARSGPKPSELSGLQIAWHPDLSDELVVMALQDHVFSEPLITSIAGNADQALQALIEGQYDALVVDSHFLRRINQAYPDLRAVMSLDHPHQFRFGVRENNTTLLSELNEYLVAEFRGEFQNIAQRRYFERADFKRAPRITRPISAFDELAQRYGNQYGFDWRLILAQAFEESRFKPAAVSSVGALGLMQVMPATAEEFGFSDLHDPDRGMHAGVHYLDWLRTQFEDELPVMERNWFSLAAYNAGPGRIRAARREAARMGLNPDRWFGHVEKAMRSFARRRTESGAPVCRCGQTVAYVRAIRSRYEAYLQLKAPVRFAGLTVDTPRGG